MARMTARPVLVGALRMAGLGALAAGATFSIGRLFGVATG